MGELSKELIALESLWVLNISLRKQNGKCLLTLWKLWFFKKCCPHRSQVSTYSHGQDQVLWSQLCPSRLCLWTFPALHKAKDSPAVPHSPLPHLARPAAVAAPTSAPRSRRGTNPTAGTTAVNTLLWQVATSLSPAAPNPCSHLRGLGADVTWAGNVWCGWWDGAGAWERNTWARVDVLAGIVVWGLESWNTDWHPSWGTNRMNKCNPRKQGVAAAHGGNGAN